MTDDEFVTYRNGRYAEALKYYDDRANTNRRLYHICSVYLIVVSVGIAPILMINPFGYGKVIAVVLSPTVAIVTAIASHFRFHENWLSYRVTWDALRHEVHWRDAKIHDYQNAGDRNALFVGRVEILISREGAEWFNRHLHKEQGSTTTIAKS